MVGAAITGVIAGCGAANEQTGAGRTTAADPALAVVHVEARYKDKRTEGTGFIYDSRRGLLLSSDHAVEAAPAIFVTLEDGTLLHARVLARAQCHDLAVLKLHPKPAGLTALAFGNSDKVNQGDRVTSLSYALRSRDGRPQLTRTEGDVAATRVTAVLHRLLPAFGPLIAHQMPLNEDGSGSPVLDKRSRVVGVNTLVGARHGAGALRGLNYALASNEVQKHLHELRPGSGSAYRGWEHEHKCHREMAMIAGVHGSAGRTDHHMGHMEGEMHSHGG